MAEQPRVSVIGAGVSGLTAIKALGDRQVPHVCFEASDEVGGNWYFGNPNGRSSAYRSLHIDTSRKSVSFADFPMDARYPDFPHHTEIHQFLREYADKVRAARANPVQHFGRARAARPGRRLADHHGRRRGALRRPAESATGITGIRRSQSVRSAQSAERARAGAGVS